MKLILASASPARAMLLKNAGLSFEVLVSGVDEEKIQADLADLSPAEIVTKLAVAKAEAVAATVSDAIVIAADSMFYFGGQLYGKPLDAVTATRRLEKMQSKFGELITGHAVINTETGICHQAFASAVVQFAPMTAAEIDAYVASGEPLEVAGNFTLDGLGAAFIDHVSGDPAAVVGLSLVTLRNLINQHGIDYTKLWQPVGNN
ncbi:MAG: Maf family protein [Candidatus Nanopelagicales bacterium]